MDGREQRDRDLSIVYSCAHCISVGTEALGKQEVLGLMLGRGIVAGGQEVMGRGGPSAEGAGSWRGTGHSNLHNCPPSMGWGWGSGDCPHTSLPL